MTRKTVLKIADRNISSEEISEIDDRIYRKIIDTTLTSSQCHKIITPEEIYPEQDSVLAVHFHPEHVPLKLIEKRIKAMFPYSTTELVIPTQHNILLSLGGYAGAEIDCYAPGFNRKVQLLVHFQSSKAENAHVLKHILSHTFKYRSKQLHDLISVILAPAREQELQRAATETGADEDLVGFVRDLTRRFQTVYQLNEQITPPETVKNKLLRYYFDEMRTCFDGAVITRAQVFIKAIKQVMKASFPLKYFYTVHEVIEEVRALGGCIVIPHPEQFWPILLAGYDVDGYEVWNPQSQQYTEFLIKVVNKENRTRKRRHKPLLVFMGDDTHMGEKVLKKEVQDPEKANRQIGLQPAWDYLTIKKSLIIGNTDRKSVIKEYKNRLNN